jgi:predicted porin
MMRNGVKEAVAIAAALAVMAPAAARGVDVKAGDWDLSFTGNVNAFATYQVCGVNPEIGGLPLACSKSTDAPNQFSIESGLLPSALVVAAKTRAYDRIDTSATLGIYPGLHVADTRTGAGSNNNFSADVRQLFLTFGDKSWGTVKLGKDLGLFGGDVILSDMLLLGVGAGAHGTLNHNVTLGHIGSGYIYADWIPQVAYSTPSLGGLQLTVAVVEGFGGNHDNGVTGFLIASPDLRNETPGVQARISYDLSGPISGRVWIGGMFQRATLNDPPTNPTLDSVAGEAGVKVDVSGLGALAYGYLGEGIGTTLIGLDATPGTVTGDSVDRRKSYGFFGQLTYKIPGTRLKPGVSYGKSFLDLATGEVNPAFLKSNELATAALFYAVTDNLTLTVEYDHVRSHSHAGDLAKSNSGAIGGIIFF